MPSFVQTVSCGSTPSRVFSRLCMAFLLFAPVGASGAISYVKTIDLGPGPHLAVPSRIAINQLTHRMYALNTANNTLSVIDTSTNTSLATILRGHTTTSAMYDVAVNESTNLVYVTDWDGAKIWVIDGVTNTVKARIGMQTPFGVAVNPSSNRLYVSSGVTNVVKVFDGATNKLVKTIKVAAQPGRLQADSATNKIYVLCGNNTVSVIDGGNNAVIGTIVVDPSATELAINENTDKIYVVFSSDGNLAVIDGASNAVVDVPLGASSNGHVAVNPNTNKIYVSSPYGGIVYEVDGTNNTVIASFSTYDPENMAVDQAAALLYVAVWTNDNMLVLDGSISSIVATLGATQAPLGIAMNPSTRKASKRQCRESRLQTPRDQQALDA